MSLICVLSAKGAPGATTTAMLLAALWPRRSVLVDADPMGGDVALRLPREDGAPLQADAGLLRLLPAARRGLTPEIVLDHCQSAIGGQLVLTGLEGPEQATAVGGLWDELGNAFQAIPDTDVIVDVGQAHGSVATLPLLRRATVVIAILAPTLPGIVHTRQRIDALRPELIAPDGSAPLLGCVVVEKSSKRGSDTDTAVAAVQERLDDLRYYGAIAHDPQAARMFDGVPSRHPERTLLVRSGTAVVDALAAVVLPAEEGSAAGGSATAGEVNPFLTAEKPASAKQLQPAGRIAGDSGANESSPATRRAARAGRTWRRKRGEE